MIRSSKVFINYFTLLRTIYYWISYKKNARLFGLASDRTCRDVGLIKLGV